MPFCRFAKDSIMFQVTPVENMFIIEYMLKAPGDFVKVYLYGLMRCFHPTGQDFSIPDIAKHLGLEEKVVHDGFRYWDRQGIIKVQSFDPLQCEFMDIRNKDPLNPELSTYRDFNLQLQQLFDTRLLQHQEFQRIYDWIEVLHLPREVVLLLIQYCINLKGKTVPIKYMDKVAEGWAQDGIFSISAAQEQLKKTDPLYTQTMQLLRHLGMRRHPSEDEMALYRKWVNEWEFNLEAIKTACAVMVKTQGPNFGYLDSVLNTYRQQTIKNAEDIKKSQNAKSESHHLVHSVLFAIGSQIKTVSPTHIALYQKWTKEHGFDHEVILSACQTLSRMGKTRFEDLDALLLRWKEKELLSMEDVQNDILTRKRVQSDMRIILERAGELREPEGSEIALLQKWTDEWQMPFEVILQAAEYSLPYKNKAAFIHKVIGQWQKDGIRTVADAKKEHKAHENTTTTTAKKELVGLKYTQHKLTPQEIDALGDVFEKI